MYNVKDDITVPNHNYCTRPIPNSNVKVPKMRTIFGQYSHKYTFIQFYLLNSFNFNDIKLYKKCINNLIVDCESII